MNLHVITATDLKKFQIENYTELLKNPLSANHKKFLKQQLKQLQNGTDNSNMRSNSNHNSCNCNKVSDLVFFRR